MSKQFKILAISEVKSRQFTDRQGMAQTYTFRDIVLTNGIDSFVASIDTRRLQGQNLAVADTVQVLGNLVCRQFRTDSGETRYINDVNIFQITRTSEIQPL